MEGREEEAEMARQKRSKLFSTTVAEVSFINYSDFSPVYEHVLIV